MTVIIPVQILFLMLKSPLTPTPHNMWHGFLVPLGCFMNEFTVGGQYIPYNIVCRRGYSIPEVIC